MIQLVILKYAVPMSKFLNKLDTNNQLAKTILYNLNPRDNEVLVTMIGNFQDGNNTWKTSIWQRLVVP